MNAIEFQHVNYLFGDQYILKNITGSFYDGEITTLVGPSGAGKSTLLSLCNGLKSPNSGEIYVKEKRITSYEVTELRRLVGIALQNAPMIDGTVFDNLALPKKLQGKTLENEQAKQMLADVGLDEELLFRHVKDLSGGQRQKVSIARTLVNQPNILLLDEITSALDRTSQKDIEQLIVQINKKYGTTIIWITHNLEQAINIGTYTWVLMEGEVVAMGKKDLLKDPKDERIRQFVNGELR